MERVGWVIIVVCLHIVAVLAPHLWHGSRPPAALRPGGLKSTTETQCPLPAPSLQELSGYSRQSPPGTFFVDNSPAHSKPLTSPFIGVHSPVIRKQAILPHIPPTTITALMIVLNITFPAILEY